MCDEMLSAEENLVYIILEGLNKPDNVPSVLKILMNMRSNMYISWYEVIAFLVRPFSRFLGIYLAPRETKM